MSQIYALVTEDLTDDEEEKEMETRPPAKGVDAAIIIAPGRDGEEEDEGLDEDLGDESKPPARTNAHLDDVDDESSSNGDDHGHGEASPKSGPEEAGPAEEGVRATSEAFSLGGKGRSAPRTVPHERRHHLHSRAVTGSPDSSPPQHADVGSPPGSDATLRSPRDAATGRVALSLQPDRAPNHSVAGGPMEARALDAAPSDRGSRGDWPLAGTTPPTQAQRSPARQGQPRDPVGPATSPATGPEPAPGPSPGQSAAEPQDHPSASPGHTHHSGAQSLVPLGSANASFSPSPTAASATAPSSGHGDWASGGSAAVVKAGVSAEPKAFVYEGDWKKRELPAEDMAFVVLGAQAVTF